MSILLLPVVSKVVEKTMNIWMAYFTSIGQDFVQSFQQILALCNLHFFSLRGMHKNFYTNINLVELKKAFDTLDYLFDENIRAAPLSNVYEQS